MLNRLPIKQVHAAHIVETCVRAAVFVNQSLFVANRDHGGDWTALPVHHANRQRATESLHQIRKPDPRRRRKIVSLSCPDEKFVELIEKFNRGTFRTRKTFALRPPDLSLRRTLMTIEKQRIQI